MTQRRTTKLTSRPISPDAPYVAIELKKIDAATTRVTLTAPHDLRLTDHRGAAFVDLKEGDDYELVRSESLGNNLFYVVTAERCYCPATTEYCKHRPKPKIIEGSVAEQSRGTSTDTTAQRDNGARGVIHNSARNFLDQCYGTSKEAEKYRQAYIDSKRSSL